MLKNVTKTSINAQAFPSTHNYCHAREHCHSYISKLRPCITCYTQRGLSKTTHTKTWLYFDIPRGSLGGQIPLTPLILPKWNLDTVARESPLSRTMGCISWSMIAAYHLEERTHARTLTHAHTHAHTHIPCLTIPQHFLDYT